MHRLQAIAHIGQRTADEQQERRRIPRIMTLATGGMVAVTLALTIFAGPIFGLCDRIGSTLLDPVHLSTLESDGGQSDGEGGGS